VEASLLGFRPQVYTGIVLTVAQTQEMNFTLSVSEVSETLNVVGGAPLVERQNSSVAGSGSARNNRTKAMSTRAGVYITD
jgi:hypothetical protein